MRLGNERGVASARTHPRHSLDAWPVLIHREKVVKTLLVPYRFPYAETSATVLQEKFHLRGHFRFKNITFEPEVPCRWILSFNSLAVAFPVWKSQFQNENNHRLANFWCLLFGHFRCENPSRNRILLQAEIFEWFLCYVTSGLKISLSNQKLSWTERFAWLLLSHFRFENLTFKSDITAGWKIWRVSLLRHSLIEKLTYKPEITSGWTTWMIFAGSLPVWKSHFCIVHYTLPHTDNFPRYVSLPVRESHL